MIWQTGKEKGEGVGKKHKMNWTEVEGLQVTTYNNRGSVQLMCSGDDTVICTTTESCIVILQSHMDPRLSSSVAQTLVHVSDTEHQRDGAHFYSLDYMSSSVSGFANAETFSCNDFQLQRLSPWEG